jgi:hypothetical protein
MAELAAVFEVEFQHGIRRIPSAGRPKSFPLWLDPKKRTLLAKGGDAREVLDLVCEAANREYEDEGERWVTLGTRIRKVKLVSEVEVVT